jgi:hypothetical protein
MARMSAGPCPETTSPASIRPPVIVTLPVVDVTKNSEHLRFAPTLTGPEFFSHVRRRLGIGGGGLGLRRGGRGERFL